MMPKVIAIITGERGRREIVRPLAAAGIACFVIDWELLRARNRRPYLRFIRSVLKLVRARKHTIVFTDMNSAFLAVIVAVAALHRTPVFLRLRGDPFAETRDQLRFHWRAHEWLPLARTLIARLLDRPLFARVHRFVPVSHWIVRRLGIESRSDVVRIPVEPGDFPPRTHAGSTPLRLLAVTNFNYPQKIAAMGRFLAQHGDWLHERGIAVTVAGAGLAWEDFRRAHAGRAEFPGFVRDVAALYATHDVFVHFSDLDAFPYVVLEAQAARLPVIVNNDCGMLEQIESGVTGLIVDLGDRAQVEAAILEMKNSRELRERLGNAGFESVSKNYSLTKIGEDLRRALYAG